MRHARRLDGLRFRAARGDRAPGQDGFLVPVGDAAALADRALALLADPELAGRVAGAARASAQRFSIPAALACYQAAITGQESPPAW